MTTKIGILGHTGRVGKLLAAELESGAWKDLSFAGGVGSKDEPDLLFQQSDVLIDFTRPEATIRHLHIAARLHKPLVIGTTGLSSAQEQELQKYSSATPIVYAANMSVGVNLILALVEQAAAKLSSEWDIEIAEAHHKNKIDAPSGTALALGKAAKKGRSTGDFATDREGKRKPGDIGFAVQRGGDVVGEHTVTFFGEGERIEIGHKATNRALFARGALKAAQWIKTKPAGLYTMRDVLGL